MQTLGKRSEIMDKLCSEIQVKKSSNIEYDNSKMLEVIDNFVRFLIGDNKVAIRRLTAIESPNIIGLKPGGEYNRIYDTLFHDLMSAVKKNLGRKIL